MSEGTDPRRTARRRLAVLAAPLVALGAAALWLGPGALAWSARAVFAGEGDAAAWRHVDPDVPLVGLVDLPGLLAAPASRELRPLFDDIAAGNGVDLTQAESHVRRILVSHDFDGETYAIASGLRLSPLLLSRMSDDWKPADRGVVPGVSDGALELHPLGPGLLLAAEHAVAADALDTALFPRDGRAALALDTPGVVARARVLPGPDVERTLASILPPSLSHFASEMERLDGELLAADTIELRLALHHVTEDAAIRSEASLQGFSRALEQARKVPAVIRLLLGDAADLVVALPAYRATRTGRVVGVTIGGAPSEVEPFLQAVLERVQGVEKPPPPAPEWPPRVPRTPAD